MRALPRNAAEHEGGQTARRDQWGGSSAVRPDCLPVGPGPQQHALFAAPFSGEVSLHWADLIARHAGGFLLQHVSAAAVGQVMRGRMAYLALPRRGASCGRAMDMAFHLAALGVVTVTPQLLPWVSHASGGAVALRRSCAGVVVPMVTGWDRDCPVWEAVHAALDINVPVFLVPDFATPEKLPVEAHLGVRAGVVPE